MKDLSARRRGCLAVRKDLRDRPIITRDDVVREHFTCNVWTVWGIRAVLSFKLHERLETHMLTSRGRYRVNSNRTSHI